MTDSPKWTDVAIVTLTIGIVFFAMMQWLEMRGAGKQTDQLMEYARKQSDAADRMASAAGNVRTATENAVTVAKSIADDARRSLNASIAASRLDQRAWVAAGISRSREHKLTPSRRPE